LRSIASALASIWKLAIPYFRSEDRRVGCLLLGAVIGLELAAVGVTVLINQWNARFYNALQDRAWNAFVHEILVFACLAALFICFRVYQTYLTQWLQIRWRRWLTKRYLRHWLYGANHYRMQVSDGGADNPDQRIAEDARMFVDLTLAISVGLLSATVTLLSFVAILWGLSAQAPLRMLGIDWSISGYLVWFALIYAIAGTAITHLLGRSLVGLNFNQQRYEADFRFDLVRVRENGEQIALLMGGTTEHVRLMGRFSKVVVNWFALMSRQKKLAFFTTGFPTNCDRVSLPGGQSSVFRRPVSAWRFDANGLRLSQRAVRAVILCQFHDVSRIGRMARSHRTS
jgi:putative ATP-binding cassette transporter